VTPLASTVLGKSYRADILGADVVPFLGRRQKRMQHLDQRLEHLDEFEDAMIGAIEAPEWL
jgi:hypothetical protein